MASSLFEDLLQIPEWRVPNFQANGDVFNYTVISVSDFSFAAAHDV